LAGREINELMYGTLDKIAKSSGPKPSNSPALVVGAKELVWKPKKKPPTAKADLQGKHMRLKSCPPKTDALTISKRREIPHSTDSVRNGNVRVFPQAVKSCPPELQEFHADSSI
jgi:hypothetical protein